MEDQITADSDEVLPSFPGGSEELNKLINKNVKYPKEAFKKGIEGTVFVGFVIHSDGTTSDHEIVKGVHPLLDEEAVRVVKLLSKWNPGIQYGKKVKVKWVLPLAYKIKR